ncbi:MAG: DMT family transporter [Candidatus Paceibacterota bacterium]
MKDILIRMDKTKLAIILVAFLWGSSFAFQKGILDFIDPVTFTFYNFLLTGIVFLVYSIYKKKNIFYRIREGILLGSLITVMEIAQMYGLHLSTAANTSFISNLGMLFIPYLGYLMYRHNVTTTDTFALLGAGVGMYFLVGGLDGLAFGDLFLLMSAFFMAFYFLMSQRYEGESGVHLSVLCAQQFLTVSFLSGVYMMLNNYDFLIPKDTASHFILLIIIFTALPYALIQWSSKHSNEMMVSMYDGVVEPLVGGIVAWFIFFEATSVLQVLGGLVMVISFGISAVYDKKHALLKK